MRHLLGWRLPACALLGAAIVGVACSSSDETSNPVVTPSDGGVGSNDTGLVDTGAIALDSGTPSPDGSTDSGDASTSPTALPKGDLPGWTQTLAEDFSTDVAAGNGFSTTYGLSWCPYDDNTKYKKANVSATGGNMVVTLDGHTGAAGVWAPGGCTNAYVGTSYGRYTLRFKAVGAAGNGTAIMVWPVSGIWGDGEIDYPEGTFDKTMSVNHHGVGCGNACGAADSTNTQVGFQQWHIATTEWTPGKVVYYLDGVVVKTVTHDVPTTPHRYTIQMAPEMPDGGVADTGQFLVDWVAIYKK